MYWGRGCLPFSPTCFNVFVWSSMVTCLFLGFSPFSASRNEVFFSLEGVAWRAVRFVLVSDRWESWLSQVADSRTKQPMRQHPHFSKLFFSNLCRYFKDHAAKIRTLFLALSPFVTICHLLSPFI